MLIEAFTEGLEQIRGRAAGPLYFRLLVMPIVVAVMGTLAGLKGARIGRPSFLWTFATEPSERVGQIRAGLKDVGKVIVMAILLDTTYQLVFLRAFYPVQLFLVVLGCAVLPYVLIREPVYLLARRCYRKNVASDTCPRGGSGKQ